MKLTKFLVEYKDKKNEVKKIYNFKLYISDTNYILIKNVYKADYNVLKMFALDDDKVNFK